MTKETDKAFDRVMDQLLKRGLLLESDAAFPNVCTLITGERMRGSWWAHPLAQRIFEVNEKLEDHPDVLITKLLSGKVTFVHRNIWPELFAIGRRREPWQMRELSNDAKQTWKLVEQAGSVRTDRITSIPAKEIGSAVRELERKLLICSRQFHTESGKHAKFLETWEDCAKRLGFEVSEVRDARERLKALVDELNHEFNAKAVLPWLKETKP